MVLAAWYCNFILAISLFSCLTQIWTQIHLLEDMLSHFIGFWHLEARSFSWARALNHSRSLQMDKMLYVLATMFSYSLCILYHVPENALLWPQQKNYSQECSWAWILQRYRICTLILPGFSVTILVAEKCLY